MGMALVVAATEATAPPRAHDHSTQSSCPGGLVKDSATQLNR